MKPSEMLRLQADMLDESKHAVADELRRRADILDDEQADYESGWEKE